jgi:hypothetical protein
MQSDHTEKKPAQGKCPHCSREIELRWRSVEAGSPSYDHPEFVKGATPKLSLRDSIIIAAILLTLLVLTILFPDVFLADPIG